MSTKDTLTAGLNEAVAKKNALKLDDYVAAAQESVAANRDAETGYINSTYDTADANTQAQYDKAITDAKASYDNEYQKNSVQKIINEMKIEQNMANLGLTDSGLNRTQQTAVQLSYANQKGNIDLARQSAIDDLTLNLNAALAESEAGRSGALLTANEKWDNQAYSLGQTNYNNDLTAYNSQISSYAEQLSDIEQAEIDAAAEVQKAQISASAENSNNASVQKIYWFRGVTDNGNYLYYNTDTGKNEEVPAYMNPYTSNDNRITYRAEYNDKDIGFFQLADGTTGYQPRGLKSEGGKFSRLEVGGKPVQFDLYGNGKYNSIWYSPSGHYWIWDDLSNSYKNMDSQVIEYLKQVL